MSWALQYSLSRQRRKLESVADASPSESRIQALASLKLFEEFSAVLRSERPFSPLPTSIGEVRLLDESLTNDPARSILVAIIELHQEEQMASFVAISPYTDAASPYEVNLQHSKLDIHVLQIQSLKRLPISCIKRSWVISHLHPADLKIARTVAKAVIWQENPAREVRAHCGLPINHPDDPRNAYLNEQAGVLNGLQAEGARIMFEQEVDEDEDEEAKKEDTIIQFPVSPPGEVVAELVAKIIDISAYFNQGFRSLPHRAAASGQMSGEKILWEHISEDGKKQIIQDRYGRFFLSITTQDVELASAGVAVRLVEPKPVLRFRKSSPTHYAGRVEIPDEFALQVTSGEKDFEFEAAPVNQS